MKVSASIRLYLATGSLAAALVAGGCTMMEPKVESYVAPPLGATWTHERRDTGSFGSATEQVTFKWAERTWEGKLMGAIESPQHVVLVTSNGGWAAILSPNGRPLLSFDPPLSYDYPLVVGKTWTKSYKATVHAARRVMSFDTKYKVEAYEDVTVPAGTFKAFRITSSSTNGTEETQWLAPELHIWVKRSQRRTAKFTGGAGTREQSLVSESIKK